MASRNLNLVVGLVALGVALWAVFYAVPSLFVTLFYTNVGKIILLATVGLAFMHDKKLALGLAAVFIVLYRFASMRFDGFFI
jgi:hypothetical protein